MALQLDSVAPFAEEKTDAIFYSSHRVSLFKIWFWLHFSIDDLRCVQFDSTQNQKYVNSMGSNFIFQFISNASSTIIVSYFPSISVNVASWH